MDQVSRGATIVLEAAYRDNAGALVDPTDPRIAIVDSGGNTQVNNAVPTRDSLGRYSYSYDVDVAALLGVWEARWSGTIAGALAQGTEQFEVVAAGVVIAGYDRWGMTEAKARTLTGDATLTADDLTNAEAEIREAIGWAPRPDSYSTAVDTDLGEPTDRRVWAFGRAVAWQAAYRQGTAAAAGDGSGVTVQAESIGDHSVTYGKRGAESGGRLGSRARRLLAQYGWYELTGATVR